MASLPLNQESTRKFIARRVEPGRETFGRPVRSPTWGESCLSRL